MLKTFAQDLVIQANKQEHDGKTGITKLEGNVNVKYGTFNLKSAHAKINVDKNQKPIEAIFYPKPSAFKNDGISQSSLKADIIRLSILENKIKAEGNTLSTVVKNKQPTVTIIADAQEYDKTNDIMTAKGDVKITYDKIKTTSRGAVVYISQTGDIEEVDLLGDAVLIQEKGEIKANKLVFNPITEEMVAVGTTYSNNILDDGTKVAVWADHQQYAKKTNTMMAGGNVKIAYQNYLANGPKATFIPSKTTKKPNNIIFYGRSKIKEDNRIIEADRIEITVDPKNFIAEGNVKTTFSKVDSKKSTTNSSKGSVTSSKDNSDSKKQTIKKKKRKRIEEEKDL
jgi:lipopolysaccharide export system protein LptA